MNVSDEIKYLLSQVDDNPSNWVVRKEAALKLYESGAFTEAADMVWQTPEIPSTDMDVAFALKIVSRAKPNRAIRLIYDLLDRNSGKAKQNIAMANVFNLIGFPMLAARCYGIAITLNPLYFDIGFESEAFLTDSTKVLESGWERQRKKECKNAFSDEVKELQGQPIILADLNQELAEGSFKNASEAAVTGDVRELGDALEKLNTVPTHPMTVRPPKQNNVQLEKTVVSKPSTRLILPPLPKNNRQN